MGRRVRPRARLHKERLPADQIHEVSDPSNHALFDLIRRPFVEDAEGVVPVEREHCPREEFREKSGVEGFDKTPFDHHFENGLVEANDSVGFAEDDGGDSLATVLFHFHQDPDAGHSGIVPVALVPIEAFSEKLLGSVPGNHPFDCI